MSTRKSAVELVWDRECTGTARSCSGDVIEVGPDRSWTPEQLLVAAVESSVLGAFMDRATEAGLEVLGYVSAAASLEDVSSAEPTIVVRPCVTIARARDRALVERLLADAIAASPVTRTLGPAVRVEAEVIALEDEPAA